MTDVTPVEGGTGDCTTRRPASVGLPRTRNCLIERTAVWSPDGKRIAFSTDIDDRSDVYTIRPDGSDVVRLTGKRLERVRSGTIGPLNTSSTASGSR